MILYVVRYHPALTETFVRDEIRALRGAGVHIELAAFDAREAALEDDPAVVHRQPHRWGWLWELPSLIVEWLRTPAWVSRRVLWLASVVRRSRRVHVHFAGEAAEWTRQACERANVPYSVTVHAVDLYKPVPTLSRVLLHACTVVAMTEFNRRLVQEKYGIAARLVRFGIDLDVTPPVRQRAGLPIVLSVGRNVPKKGLDLVCRVASRVDRPAQFVVYSNLPPTEAVSVRGLVPHEEVLSAFAEASIFLLPCRVAPDGDMDGLPVVIVEAMARGLPVITTRVSGIPELVDDSAGWLVDPDDEEALLGAVREALDHPEDAARRGALGRARVVENGYSREALVAAMREVLGA